MKTADRGSPGGGFAERLRQARTDAGMSQRDLERLSGIPKSRISRYENGHLLPSLGGLRKLSKSLGLPDSSLLGERDDVHSIFVDALRRHGVSFGSGREAEAAAELIATRLFIEDKGNVGWRADPASHLE